MQRLLVDCSTLPNESFVVWQHFLPTNIADRLALRRPVATPFCRKQTHTANPRHADFLQTKYRPYIFRRLVATVMSNATKCRAFAVFDKSASSIQNKIAPLDALRRGSDFGLQNHAWQTLLPRQTGCLGLCSAALAQKKRTCNGCRFSFYKSILAGIFDSRLREYRTYKTRFYLFINSAILEYIFSLSPLPVVFNLKRGISYL